MLFNYKKTFLGCKSTGSCPPYTNKELSPYFQEISRINQYLSNHPIDFMIDEVEKSSLDHIAKGETQLAFSIKEITQYIPYTHYIDSERDVFYFIGNLISQTKKITQEIIKSIKESPLDKESIVHLNTMIKMSAEINIIYESLKKKNIILKEADSLFNLIGEEYPLFDNLKMVYPHFNEIISWNNALISAKESINKQLLANFSFDMKELDTIYSYYEDRGKWMDHMRSLQNNNLMHSDEKLNHMQKVYVKNMRSFILSLQEGVINFLRFGIVCINKERSHAHSILNSNIMDFYDLKVQNIKDNVERDKKKIQYQKENIPAYFIKLLKDNEDKLDYLLNNKSDFLKNEIKERKEFESKILNSALTQKNIDVFIEDLKQDVLGFKNEIINNEANENIIKVEKISDDIIQCKYKDKMIYLISDNIPENVKIEYACLRFSAFSMNVKDFKKLNKEELNNSDLLRQKTSNINDVKYTNFNNIPEFISSLQDNHMQNYFLGEEDIEVECCYLI